MRKVIHTFLSFVTSEDPIAKPYMQWNKWGFHLRRDVYGNTTEVNEVTLHLPVGQ